MSNSKHPPERGRRRRKSLLTSSLPPALGNYPFACKYCHYLTANMGRVCKQCLKAGKGG